MAVVGGGLAGLSAALELARRGRTVRLLEADRLGAGASGRNGGQVIAGLACEMETIEAQLGLLAARQVFAMSCEAIALLRQHAAQHADQAQWQSGYLTAATSPRRGAALVRAARRLQATYGHPLQAIEPTALHRWIDSPRFHSAVHDPLSGHLNPLQLALGIATAAEAAGAVLHEGSPVQALALEGTGWRLSCPQGSVQADQVVLAGNATLGERLRAGSPPRLERALRRLGARVMPVGTFVACTEPLDPRTWQRLLPTRAAVSTSEFVLDYFRPTADHRLLFGGGASYSTRVPSDLAGMLRRRIVRTFPSLADARVTHAWGGFVDITLNLAPDFGRLGALAREGGDTVPAAPGGDPLDRIYHLQGFSGHGVALTLLAGRLVAEAASGDAARLDVFSRLRHRAFPGGRALRTPLLALGMAWYRLRDLLG